MGAGFFIGKIEMEMVDIVATSNFINNKIGSIRRKDRLRVPENLANEFIKLGVAKLNPMMAVCRNKPTLTVPPDDGGGKLYASLPAGQASPKKTAILLQGAHCGSASQSMIVSSDCLAPMSSTLVTAHGGESTTKKSKKSSMAKSGHKIINLQSSSD